jgi:outer membrane lipoprotein-sorting protein
MRKGVRWLVPAAVATVVAGGALAPGASADLPAKTPEQVLVLAQQGADLDAFSGTVSVRTDLGIPTALLEAAGGQQSGPPTQGDRTLRVWKDGDERSRVSVASTMGEQTLVRDGDQVWAWDSATATATRVVLPEPDPASADKPADAPPPWLADGPVDPGEAARWVLDRLDGYTAVTAGEPTVVAGREAYELVLVPRQDGTLVGRAALAVDAATGAVLRLQVTATGASSPAVDIAYTAFDPSAPDASVFVFTPPPGSTVEEKVVSAPPTSPQEASTPDAPRPEVLGEGWTSVVVVPASAGAAAQLTGSLPPGVAQPVAGGEVVTTALVSVLLADDGRVLAGAVTPQVLEAAAGG